MENKTRISFDEVELLTYELKAKFLIENDWVNYYHKDAWLNNNITYSKPDYASIDTNSAYYNEINKGIPEVHKSDYGVNYYDENGQYIESKSFDKDNNLIV